MSGLYRSCHKEDGFLGNHNKNINIRNRNYSNSRLFPLSREQQYEKKTIQQINSNSHVNPSVPNKEIRRYCLDRIKAPQMSSQVQGVKKNTSLKYLRKEYSMKLVNKTNGNAASTEGLAFKTQNSSIKQISEKQRTISIKRRVELIKKKQNKLKLTLKQKASPSSHEKSCDVSIGEKLQHKNLDKITTMQNTERFASQQNYDRFIFDSNKIQSENVLGEGLKKCSSSKIKILVKNPFEKLMKMQELKQVGCKPVVEEIEKMNASRILPPLDQTTTSFNQQKQLQEMLALM